MTRTIKKAILIIVTCLGICMFGLAVFNSKAISGSVTTVNALEGVTITFMNEDGSILKENKYNIGDFIQTPMVKPTKAADKTYNYEFDYWVDGNGEWAVIGFAETDMTYYPHFEKSYINYLITFSNYDGTVIEAKNYHYWETVIEPPRDKCVKPDDERYTYEFIGWDSELRLCNDDMIYTALYKGIEKKYKIQFVNYDNTLIKGVEYTWGQKIETINEIPNKPSDDMYSYTFDYWEGFETGDVYCEGEMTFKAHYKQTENKYNVYFVNYDDTFVAQVEYTWGQKIQAINDIPTKPSDDTYSYTFDYWEGLETEDVYCNGERTFKAHYKQTEKKYKIRFVNYDDTLVEEVEYAWGQKIQAINEIPTKPSDDTHAYEFKYWEGLEAGTVCNGERTFKAHYQEKARTYIVKFLNYDNTLVKEVEYARGKKIEKISDIPTKPSDNTYSYTFDYWEGFESVEIYEDKEFKAVYKKEFREYTVTFLGYNGETLSEKKYHYGDKVEVPDMSGATSDMTYIYSFIGWDKEVKETCEGDAEYIVQYTKEYIDYTIVFKDYDGNIISSKIYHYGDKIQIPANPTREDDIIKIHTFIGWDKEVKETCEGNEVYTARYSEELAPLPIQPETGCSGSVASGEGSGNILMAVCSLFICFAVIVVKKKKSHC